LVLLEIFIRRIQNIGSLYYLDAWFVAFAFGFFILSSRSKSVAVFVALFLSFGVLSEFSNLIYFGYWLYPMDIWLAFEKSGEVFQAAPSIISFNKTSFALALVAGLLPILLLFLRNRAKQSKFISILAILLLLLYPVKIYFQDFDIGRNIKMTNGVSESFSLHSQPFCRKNNSGRNFWTF